MLLLKNIGRSLSTIILYTDTCNLLLYILIASNRLSEFLPLIDAFIVLIVSSVSLNMPDIKLMCTFYFE